MNERVRNQKEGKVMEKRGKTSIKRNKYKMVIIKAGLAV